MSIANHNLSKSSDEIQKIFAKFPPELVAENLAKIPSINDKKLNVDLCLRNLTLEILEKSSFKEVIPYISLSIDLALQDIITPNLTLHLFSDAFNSKPISECEQIFGHLELCISRLKQNATIFNTCRVNLLRTCNDLMRRLSKSMNTTFCGRIQMFLSHLLSLDEKSGLNIMSIFHTENITPFNEALSDDAFSSVNVTELLCLEEDKDDDVDNETSKQQHEAVNGGGGDGNKSRTSHPHKRPKLDNQLYVKFWSLQNFFRFPVQCFEKPKWLEFMGSTQLVLEFFENFRLDPQHCGEKSSSNFSNKNSSNNTNQSNQAASKKRKCPYEILEDDADFLELFPDSDEELEQSSTKRSAVNLESGHTRVGDKQDGVEELHIDANYSKYLTSEKVFDLQLMDAQFRRCILLQMLITFQYLTADVRFKPRDQTLTETQKTWIVEQNERAFRLLRQLEGREDGGGAESNSNSKMNDGFVQLVRCILSRELLWNDWKNRGCASIVREPIKMPGDETVATPEEGEEGGGEATKPTETKKKASQRDSFYFPNCPAMTKLWNMPSSFSSSTGNSSSVSSKNSEKSRVKNSLCEETLIRQFSLAHKQIRDGIAEQKNSNSASNSSSTSSTTALTSSSGGEGGADSTTTGNNNSAATSTASSSSSSSTNSGASPSAVVEFSLGKNERWTWRALRTLSKFWPHFYANWTTAGLPLNNYFCYMLYDKMTTTTTTTTGSSSATKSTKSATPPLTNTQQQQQQHQNSSKQQQLIESAVSQCKGRWTALGLALGFSSAEIYSLADAINVKHDAEESPEMVERILSEWKAKSQSPSQKNSSDWMKELRDTLLQLNMQQMETGD